MSSELQNNLVTGSEESEETQTTEVPTASLLSFSDDAVTITSTSEDFIGIEDLTKTSEAYKEDVGVKEENNELINGDIEKNDLLSESLKEDEVVTASTLAPTTDEGEHEINLKSPLGKFLIQQKVSVTAIKIVYWDNVYRSAGIFCGMLFLLLSMYTYTILSVATNFGIAVLAVAFLYRIGMTIVNAVQKTSAEHPFKNLLQQKIEVSQETVDKLGKFVHGEINCTISSLQKLFLIEDVFQSLKFGVTLWLISYIGSWFSPLTVTILALIVVFTVPKLYEEKQVEIDKTVGLISQKMKESVTQVESKIPEKVMAFMKKEKKE